MERTLYCYRYTPLDDYDCEAIWAFVQRHQGHISILAGGSINFYVPAEYLSIFVLAYPGLERVPSHDYV